MSYFTGGFGPNAGGFRQALPHGAVEGLQAEGKLTIRSGRQLTLPFRDAETLADTAGSAKNSAQFEAPAKGRSRLGLPAAGSAEDVATLARLEINGQVFDGINSSLQSPATSITLKRVNAQTITHAEADVVQQAVDAGMVGTARRAEMWVDRLPCEACGSKGGLRSLARNLGVDELVVHSPYGTMTFTPTP